MEILKIYGFSNFGAMDQKREGGSYPPLWISQILMKN